MLLGQAATAQSPRPYRPAIDVLDYDLTLDLPDTGRAIKGNALLTIKRTAPTDSLVLDLLDLTVDRVTIDGRDTRFSRTPEHVAIPLPKGKSGTFHVSVRYS